MVAGHAARVPGLDTRARILAAALDLFAERGYAGTSVRDISERLGVTKAALYYHFPSKEAILDALLDPVLTELDELVRIAVRIPRPEPRLLLERMVNLLADSGGILIAFANDPSVLHRRLDKTDLFAQQELIVQALAGPSATPSRLVRARCALGCVRDGILGTAFVKLRGQSATGSGDGHGEVGVTDSVGFRAREHPDAGGIATEAVEVRRLGGADVPSLTSPLLPAELRHEIVEAALAALGPGQPEG